MNKILVGYDHTASAQHALRWLDVFVPYEAEVILLYSCVVSFMNSLEEEATLELIEREHQRLREAVQEKDERFVFSTRVSFDPPAESLVEVADSEEVDLLVVGSANGSGIAQFLVGTVAGEVIRNAHVSVVVAKPQR